MQELVNYTIKSQLHNRGVLGSILDGVISSFASVDPLFIDHFTTQNVVYQVKLQELVNYKNLSSENWNYKD